jgi:hypothetical protein
VKYVEGSEDPFLIFGIGLNIFKKQLMEFPKLFCFFLILTLPIIIIYRIGDDVDYVLNAHTTFGGFSIANLGMDSVKCKTAPFAMEEAHLACPYGRIGKMKKNLFGINNF